MAGGGGGGGVRDQRAQFKTIPSFSADQTLYIILRSIPIKYVLKPQEDRVFEFPLSSLFAPLISLIRVTIVLTPVYAILIFLCHVLRIPTG